MTPLEAAKVLAGDAPTYGHSISSFVCPCLIEDHGDCYYCDAPLIGPSLEPLGEHDPDCPWLAMPKIVAALERLEQYDRTVDIWQAGTGEDPRVDNACAKVALKSIRRSGSEGPV